MNNGTTDKERFIKSPQWFFREFLREARSLTQVKIMGEVINQTYGYHKQQDQTTLTRLSKVLNLSRDAVSKNIQPLVNKGFIELLSLKGNPLDTPELRRINGLSRQLIIFRIPGNLPVRIDDKYLSEVTATKRSESLHNKRNTTKENITKESSIAASQRHSLSLVTPFKKNKIKKHFTTYREALNREKCFECGCLLYSTTQFNRTKKKYGMVLCRKCESYLYGV